MGRGYSGKILVSNGGFEWMNGINPQVQNFMKSLFLEVVTKYDVDGVQGDDRLPAMPVAGGYDTYTVELYKQEHGGQSPPQNGKDAAWITWRTDKLTAFLGNLYSAVKAIKPNLQVSSSPSIYHSMGGVLIQSGSWNPTEEYLNAMITENRNNGIKGEVMFFYEGLKKHTSYFENTYPSK